MCDKSGNRFGASHPTRREFLVKSPILLGVAAGLGSFGGIAKASANNKVGSASLAGNSAPSVKYVFKSDPRAGIYGFGVIPG